MTVDGSVIKNVTREAVRNVQVNVPSIFRSDLLSSFDVYFEREACDLATSCGGSGSGVLLGVDAGMANDYQVYEVYALVKRV